MRAEPNEDPFAFVERLLDEQQLKHFDMAEMVGEYRRMIEDLRDSHDAEAVRLARNLPGAKYHVATTYVRENWLVLQAELQRLFPEQPEPAES